ncbi:peptidase inhibitor family I36 protein [Streptomyces sp. NPDC003006]
MREKFSALLVAGAAVAAAAMPVSTAHAADGYDRCPDGYYCMFSGLDGTGDMIKLAVTSSGPTGKGNFFPSYRDFFSSVQFDGPGGPSCGTPPGELPGG